MVNPLLGRWQIDTDQSTGVAANVPDRVASVQWEFTEDQAIAAGAALTVSYEVEADRVTVMGFEGWETVYQLLDDDHVAIESPSGRIVLKRLD